MKKIVFWVKITVLCLKYRKDSDTLCEKIFDLSEEELNIYRERVLKLYYRKGYYGDLYLLRYFDGMIRAKRNGIKSFDEAFENLKDFEKYCVEEKIGY